MPRNVFEELFFRIAQYELSINLDCGGFGELEEWNRQQHLENGKAFCEWLRGYVARLADEGEKEKVPEGYDEDVTEQFPVAVERGLQVMRRSSWYYVLQDNERLNEKALRQNGVDSFVEGIV